MSYRSKRTRAAGLAATNAPDTVSNKAPKLVSSQPLQKEPKASIPSTSVQKSGEANGRWGPFTPRNTQNPPSSPTTNISTQPPPPQSNPIWKKPLINNVPSSLSNTSTQDLPLSSNTSTSKPQKSIPTMRNPTNVTNPPSITKTHNFPSSSTQNTSTVPQKIPPPKLSKPPIFPSTSHTSHQPLLQEMQDDHTANKDKGKHACGGAAKEKSKIFKLRRRASLPKWLGAIEYDDKEEVLTIDTDGKKRLISGPIPQIEVWNNNGVKYVVHFNDFCQPIRKGGHILVQFLGSIAKEERFCPLSEKTWRKLDASFKRDISKAIRDRFVIPDEEKYYTQALQRVDKVWRNYKHDHKKRYFKPDEKSITEIVDNPPNGVSKSNWVNLVNYWNLERGKELSEIGKRQEHL